MRVIWPKLNIVHLEMHYCLLWRKYHVKLVSAWKILIRENAACVSLFYCFSSALSMGGLKSWRPKNKIKLRLSKKPLASDFYFHMQCTTCNCYGKLSKIAVGSDLKKMSTYYFILHKLFSCLEHAHERFQNLWWIICQN